MRTFLLLALLPLAVTISALPRPSSRPSGSGASASRRARSRTVFQPWSEKPEAVEESRQVLGEMYNRLQENNRIVDEAETETEAAFQLADGTKNRRLWNDYNNKAHNLQVQQSLRDEALAAIRDRETFLRIPEGSGVMFAGLSDDEMDGAGTQGSGRNGAGQGDVDPSHAQHWGTHNPEEGGAGPSHFPYWGSHRGEAGGGGAGHAPYWRFDGAGPSHIQSWNSDSD